MEWAKIERFTGDLGLKPSAGRLNVSGAGELTHEPKTGADFSVTGDLSVADVDVARAEMGHLAMQRASGNYSLRTRISPAGEAGTAGSLGFQAATGKIELPDGLAVDVRPGGPVADRSQAGHRDRRQPRLAGQTALDVADAALSGPAVASAAS